MAPRGCHAASPPPAGPPPPSATNRFKGEGQVDAEPPNTGDPNPYAGLGRGAQMLGYGGHFHTKAQRSSPTFAQPRTARATSRRNQHNHDQYHADAGTV